MPGKFGTFSHFEPDPLPAHVELPRPAVHADDCLDQEWLNNRVGVLFDAVTAPRGVGVPCPLDCTLAVAWAEDGAQVVGACSVKACEPGTTPTDW